MIKLNLFLFLFLNLTPFVIITVVIAFWLPSSLNSEGTGAGDTTQNCLLKPVTIIFYCFCTALENHLHSEVIPLIGKVIPAGRVCDPGVLTKMSIFQ